MKILNHAKRWFVLRNSDAPGAFRVTFCFITDKDAPAGTHNVCWAVMK